MRMIGIVVGVAICFAAAPSLGQAPTRLIDLEYLDKARDQALENDRSNAPREWRNPKTGSSGTVIVYPAQAGRDGDCRRYEITWIFEGGRERYVGRACRKVEGKWERADETRDASYSRQERPGPTEPAPAIPAVSPADLQLHDQLKRLSYIKSGGSADSQKAIAEFQIDEGLVPTGKGDPTTYTRAMEAVSRLRVGTACPGAFKPEQRGVCGTSQ